MLLHFIAVRPGAALSPRPGIARRAPQWLRQVCTRIFGGGVIAGMALFPLAVSGEELLLNPSFDNALAGWEIRGSVAPSSGLAVLTDDADYSLLYQLVPAVDGLFTLEIDFRSALSAEVSPGAVRDSAFATIYLTDSLSTFDIPSRVFDDEILLFDLDATGSTVYGSGIIFPIPGRPQFFTFRRTFNSNFAGIAPAFELFDLNGINSDSAWAIDAVRLQAVPEPASSFLLLLALAGSLFPRRLESSSMKRNGTEYDRGGAEDA